MNGFLDPNGRFYECEFGEHGKLATQIVKQNNIPSFRGDLKMYHFDDQKLKRDGYLYFGYTGDLGTNTDSYVFVDFDNMNITSDQVQWVLENKNRITAKQFEDFNELL